MQCVMLNFKKNPTTSFFVSFATVTGLDPVRHLGLTLQQILPHMMKMVKTSVLALFVVLCSFSIMSGLVDLHLTKGAG